MEAKQTEELILRAAERLFLEQGFKETTTAQIAKEAGCNSALVHYYFRTKEKLFARIFESKIELYLQGLFIELDELQSVEELVRYTVHSHWRFMLEHSSLAIFILKEILMMSERTRFFVERHLEMRAHASQKIELLLAREAARGNSYQIDAAAILRLILSLDGSYFAQLLIRCKAFDQEPNPEEVSALQEEIITIILARLHYRP